MRGGGRDGVKRMHYFKRKLPIVDEQDFIGNAHLRFVGEWML